MSPSKSNISNTGIRQFIERKQIKYIKNLQKETKRILDSIKKETKRNKLEAFVKDANQLDTKDSLLEGNRNSENLETLNLYTKVLSLLSNHEKEENWNQGLAICKQTAELGNSDAQYICGIALEDPSLSDSYLRQAAKQEHAKAQFELWLRESSTLNDTQAIKWLKKSAINEYAIAQLTMGVLELIEGKSYNREDAFKWISQAAEQDNLDAQILLTAMYAEGIGTQSNQKLSFKYMLLAAEKGDVYSQYKVGEAYDLGSGTDKYAKQALKWYRMAAENGDPHAQYRLGLMIFDGDETAPNAEEAMKLFESASLTLNIAKYPLGIGYVTGKGVPKDVRKGLMLLDEAAVNEEDQKLSESIHNEISTFLTQKFLKRVYSQLKYVDVSHDFKKTTVAKENDDLTLKSLKENEVLLEKKFVSSFKMPTSGSIRTSFLKTIITSLALVFGSLLLANVIFNFTAEFETLLMIIAGGFILSFLIGGGRISSSKNKRAEEKNKLYTPSKEIYFISRELQELKEDINRNYSSQYYRVEDIKKKIYKSFGILSEDKNKNNYIILSLVFIVASIFFGFIAGLFFSVILYIILVASPMMLNGLFVGKSKEATLKRIEEVEYNFYSYLGTLLDYKLLLILRNTGANRYLFSKCDYTDPSRKGYFYVNHDMDDEVEIFRKYIDSSLSIRTTSLYKLFVERTINACQLHVQMEKIKKIQDKGEIIDPNELGKLITNTSIMISCFFDHSLNTASFLYFDPIKTLNEYSDPDSEKMKIAGKLAEYFSEIKKKQAMSGYDLEGFSLKSEFIKRIGMP